jgi:imidazoleglycerol-phosphate dehydratase
MKKISNKRTTKETWNLGPRIASLDRETKETKVSAKVNLDGTGQSSISTGSKFLDHIIQLLSTHSLIDIEVKAEGDLRHHIVEDIALTLGATLSKALGGREGIKRFGYAYAPMDEALALSSVDLVKRCYFVPTNLEFRRQYIEDLASEDLQHFFNSLCTSINCTIHIQLLYGKNDHHKAEACVKALALSLRDAVARDPRRSATPSSKGIM